MNTNEVLSYEMLVRVKDFGSSRSADFPAAGRGGELFAEVTAVVTDLSHQSTVQTASAGEVLVNNATKARLRASLREDLRALNRTARVITADNQDLKKKFRLPKRSDQHLLSAARAFLQDAEPLAAEFTKHEILPSVLLKFKNDVDSFQAVISELNQNRESRVQATARLETLLSRGIRAMQKLDVIVRNKYRADKPSLTAWESARHLEQNHPRSKDQPKTDQGKAQPTPQTTSAASAG